MMKKEATRFVIKWKRKNLLGESCRIETSPKIIYEILPLPAINRIRYVVPRICKSVNNHPVILLVCYLA